MSPPKPENDPVEKGLHQLGQQIGGGPAQPGAAEDPAENPVEKGLHELGRQIDEASRTGGADAARPTSAEEDRRSTGPGARRPEGSFPQAHGGLGRGARWHWSSC